MIINYLGVTVCSGVFSDETIKELCGEYCFQNKIEFKDSNISLIPESGLETNGLIERIIYSKYPEKKQNQDEKWISSYNTKLKALGVENLETQIVSMVVSFFEGSSLENTLVDVPTSLKPYFEKLVKVGVRIEWAERCIVEGLLSFKENRESKFPQYPL